MKKHVSRLLQPGVIWYSIVLLAFSAAAAALDQFYLAGAELLVTIVVFAVSRARFAHRKRALIEYVQSATDSVGVSVHAGSPFPMAVLHLPEAEIVWGNQDFYAITGLTDATRYQTMQSVVPGFTIDWLREGRTEFPGDQLIRGRRYRIYGNFVRSEDEETTVKLATVYFADMTVSKWMEGSRALSRRLERNRYLMVYENRDFEKLQKGKFSVLESIRSVVSPTGIAATISLGIGKDGASFEEDYNFATLSIEMALSRGGDQAVIKDRYNFSFYGGRTKEAERHTKVKSRVVAGSLSELIAQSSEVFIMGHRMADLDAVGAAVGLVSLCRKKGKRARIVLDLKNNAAGALIRELRALPEYAGVFISGDDALVEADNRSLLIIVDTNRPDQVESKALLEAVPRVAVIDHHRRAADYIDHAVLSLHEPFSSSAAELVTELLQYAVEPRDIRPLEAQALLAGIVLDTKNFNVRTGSRTFEAAAFLRRTGADTVDVKKLFQSDLDSTIARYQIVQAAKLYRDEIAIAAVEHTTTRTIASQAADELLSISGILTSFVLYPDGNQVVICARSIGTCNVQVVLEPLGGGGNAASAGAQIKNAQLPDVLEKLVASIDKFYG